MNNKNNHINDAKASIASFINNVEVTIPELKNIQNNIQNSLYDNVTNIQYEPTSIDINISSISNPVNYVDAFGYVDNIPTYSNECSYAAKLEDLINRVNLYIIFWYSYRSITLAIPVEVNVYYFICFP